MRISSLKHRVSGFSLIEVLIAVVVLATGLLAMAALQGKLASNSADAKARSQVAALMTGVIDNQRASGYDSLASFPRTTCTTTTPTAVQSAICTSESDAGISGLGLTMTVTTYYGASGGGAFTTTACADCAEYKKIVMKADWTDAVGAGRSLSLDNIASALGLSSSSTLLNTPLTSTSLTPAVHQPNPSLTDGVIPIAVGNNTDAASTNPKPTLAQTLPSTSFNTLTYTQGALDTSITSTIQKRVETVVAECACKLSTTNPLLGDVFLGASTFRPTFWNGTKYVAPEDAKITPYSAQHPSVVGTQDDRCTLVCRDHHDTSTDTVKYDSVTGDLNRYKATVNVTKVKGKSVVTVALARDTDGDPIAVTASTDTYLDAGRLIRVDGLWRVATDIHSEQLGLLATTPAGEATSPAPTSGSEAAYEDFVIDYLGQKLSEVLDGASAPIADDVFNSHGLNAPDTITALTASGNYKYLHARGLYLDYLEQDALDKLVNVNSNCTDFPNCLLPYLPFNTVNVTQLAKWAPLSASEATNGKIGVTNTTNKDSATLCNGTDQVRACVSGISSSSGNTDLDEAVATMGKSNSAVASSQEISPYELDPANNLDDSQAFEVSGTDTASEFFAELTGASTTLSPSSTVLSFWTDDLSTNNEPTVKWSIGSAFGNCFGNLSRTDTNPNPYDCITTLPLTTSPAMTVTLGNYNQVVPQTVDNPCAGGTGKYQQPTLVCYAVDTASVALKDVSTGIVLPGYSTTASSAGTSKTTSEQTVISISGSTSITKSQAILHVEYINNGTALGAATCDAVTFVPTFTDPTTCN
jgi:type IV pilus modification protein PilV